MKLSRVRSLLPYVMVLAAFGWSLWHVARPRASETSGKTVIRVGHWLLHAGMRESFDQAIADYENLHPDVSVEQIAVPVRSYSMWLRTRLIGETAPDLTGMLNANEEIASRYFLPLGPWLDTPNPYNRGTPLETVPWRETFVDGLDSMRQLYGPVSGEVLGMNLQINTQRLFYNRNLLRTVTGTDQPPADFTELRALGEKVAAYNARTGAKIVPIASCGPYARYLFNTLVPTQTQRLAVEQSPSLTLQYSTPNLAVAFLRGELSYRTPALRSGLELMQDVTALMPVGFNQLARDDALFAYLQEQAVMFFAGSWDYGVLVRDGPFPTGIAPLPVPGREDPRYGPFGLGPISEAAGSPEAALGITRTSKHPEQALDFLRFLTSRDVAANFSRQSHRIASIVSTPPPPDAPELAPSLGGEVNGFPLDFLLLPGGNTNTLFESNVHRALGRQGDVDAFIDEIEPRLKETLRRDLGQLRKNQLRDIRRLDARLAFDLTRPDAPPADWARIAESQSAIQQESLPLARELE
jgi:multiple sugar transport system substrate-binding protein/raffinose/stachyose/melibiose transport system substrate-binding protein